MENNRVIFINDNLNQFDISNFEYVGIQKVSEIVTNVENIIMLKSVDDFYTTEVMFHFKDKTTKKNYYFLINDFGFMNYSVHFSEKHNLIPIIEEYSDISLVIHEYLNSTKIDVNNDEISMHYKDGMRILSLQEFKERLSKYYPQIHNDFIDEIEDFSYKMVITKEKLETIDETMMEKLQKQFTIKKLDNGSIEFYKLKFSYEK